MRIQQNRTNYGLARSEIIQKTICELLLLHGKLCEAFPYIQLDSLTPQQREAFRTKRGVTALTGRFEVTDTSDEDRKKWRGLLQAALEPRLQILRDSDRKGYAAYKRVENMIVKRWKAQLDIH